MSNSVAFLRPNSRLIEVQLVSYLFSILELETTFVYLFLELKTISVYLLIHIVFSFFKNIFTKSEQYENRENNTKKKCCASISYCLPLLSVSLTRNNVWIIINLSYCHVSKTMKSRPARKKYEGNAMPLASLSTKLRWKL